MMLTLALKSITTFRIHQRFHTLLVYSMLINYMLVRTDAESVTLMKNPTKSSVSTPWSWSATGVSAVNIGRWKNSWPNDDRSKPVQYSACDVSANSQPDQWLRSDVIDVRAANKIDINIEYAMSNCSVLNIAYCRHDFDLYLHKSRTKLRPNDIPDPYTSVSVYEKIGTVNPRVLTTGHLSKAENKQTYSLIVDSAKPYVYLAFHYRGGCVSLFTVSVQYYRCSSIALSSSLVLLPVTTAPANGSVQVKGSCNAQHTKPLTNESDLYGYCKDDGEWSTDRYHGECGCDYGYGKFEVNGGSECRACPIRTYKNTVSNSNCSKCPLNSIQDSKRTSCICDNGFYRTEKETKFDNCTAQPSAPRGLVNTFLNASFVIITWSPPSDSGGRSDLYYTVECKRCNDTKEDCTKDCTGSSIIVNQNFRLASVNSLSAYTYYQFKVYAKNGVSVVAKKNNDMAEYIDDIWRTEETVPGSPVVTIKRLSLTSVFLSWEVQEKNGVITYYHVTYRSLDQPTNWKTFNTRFTNATITGLETGKEYEFNIQAATRSGLGHPSTLALKVNYNSPDKGKIDVTIPVLGAIVGLLILAFAVVIIFFLIRRRRISNQANQNQKPIVKFVPPVKRTNDTNTFSGGFSNPEESFDGETSESRDGLYIMITDDTIWEIPRENISVIKRLGSGNFGYVDKALAIGLPGIPGQVTVAVKSLKENVKDKDKEDFLTELNLMMRLAPHTHVVRLYGCCTKPGGPQSIILEYLPYGDLLGYLRRSRGHEDAYCSGDLRPESKLSSKDMIKFAWMIADGMNFLAENKCVHRDLAARNVLVGEGKICKISDLGLARKISEDIYTRSSGARLPVKWMPPESLFFAQSTIASDVWSYGIVLWEIFTLGDSPYPGFQGRDVTKLLREGYRMPRPRHLSETLYSLMMRCWQEKPEDRPSFSSICEEIMTFSKVTEDYINLDIFDDGLYVNFDVL